MLDTISYIGDVLKFFAVPAAFFELTSEHTRIFIDKKVASFGRRYFRTTLLLVLGLYVLVLTSGLIAEYAVNVSYFLVVVSFIVGLISIGNYAIVLIWTVLILLGWGLYSVIPDSATLAAYTPYYHLEAFLENWSSPTAYLLLHFDIDEAFGTLRQHTVDLEFTFKQIREEGITSSWLDLFFSGLEFRALVLAKGAFIYSTLLLNIIVVTILLLLPLLFLSGFVHSIYHVSGIFKNKFDLVSSTRMPICAALIWAVGETISFGVHSFVFFDLT